MTSSPPRAGAGARVVNSPVLGPESLGRLDSELHDFDTTDTARYPGPPGPGPVPTVPVPVPGFDADAVTRWGFQAAAAVEANQDEPELTLSFSGCLALVGVLNQLVRRGRAQALIATPLAAGRLGPGCPGVRARRRGPAPDAMGELPWYRNRRTFPTDPERYLRHVVT